MSARVRALADDLCLSLGGAGEVIGPASQRPPRFLLFHAANSICAQKVRAVLAQCRISYESQSLNIFAGQTYLPSYVRLRMIGCDEAGVALVTHHSGSTSMSRHGCDPAVVPTLVDRHAGRVIIDSKRICFYLDEVAAQAEPLAPTALRQAIDAEIEIIDNLPNYQMLTGRPSGPDRRPQKLRGQNGVDFAMSKVARCDRYVVEFADQPDLVRAYQAKRAKELDAAHHLFGDDAMRLAYAKAEEACRSLNGRLSQRDSLWLLGNAITMADLFWAIALLRMKNLGAGVIWEQNALPAVQDYVAAVEDLESIRSSVLTWPGALF